MFEELEDILDEIVPDSSDCIIHDEEFMDNLTEDAGEDDIDEDEETNPSSKNEEK